MEIPTLGLLQILEGETGDPNGVPCLALHCEICILQDTINNIDTVKRLNGKRRRDG